MSESHDPRVRRARAQCDIWIDVLSAWRGRYEDDDRHAGIGWITSVILELEDTPERQAGWLCVTDTGTPGLGWQTRKDTGQFSVHSLCRSMRGTRFLDLTRGQFRAAAKASNVCLPVCHATLYLEEDKQRQPCPDGPAHDWWPYQHAYKWRCRTCGKLYEVEPPQWYAERSSRKSEETPVIDPISVMNIP